MLALSVRQPYAELILRGIKTAELRSRPTSIVGRRFYLYAAKAKAKPTMVEGVVSGGEGGSSRVWSRDLAVAAPPAWMVELAEQVRLFEAQADAASLPRGVIVGTAVIDRVVPPDPADGESGRYRWQLRDVQRLDHPLRPMGQPQPVWFSPF